MWSSSNEDHGVASRMGTGEAPSRCRARGVCSIGPAGGSGTSLKTDAARPQHTAVYTWNLAPSFNERSFTFEPPPGTAKVPMAEVEAMRRQARRRPR